MTTIRSPGDSTPNDMRDREEARVDRRGDEIPTHHIEIEHWLPRMTSGARDARQGLAPQGDPLLGHRSDGEALAPFSSPPRNDRPTLASPHAQTKAVLLLPAPIVRLKCTFHDWFS